MESSVTIPLAYYEEIKLESDELKLLRKDSTYSIVWQLGCDKMIESLNKDETIKALNDGISRLIDDRCKFEVSYNSEIRKLEREIENNNRIISEAQDRIVEMKYNHKRQLDELIHPWFVTYTSPIGILNKIYLYFKK